MPKNPSTGAAPVALIIAILAFGVGAAMGFALGGKAKWQAGYDAGAMEAKKTVEAKLGQADLLRPEPEHKKLVGVVKAIEGSVLIIETPPIVSANPLRDPPPTRRRVTVTSTTVVMQAVEKSAEEKEADQKAFFAADKAFRESLDTNPETAETLEPRRPPEPPSSTKTEKAAPTDIQVGSNVEVTSATDIYRAESFDAVTILIVNRSTVTAGMPVDASTFPGSAPADLPAPAAPPAPGRP